jgi:hypothetical protein
MRKLLLSFLIMVFVSALAGSAAAAEFKPTPKANSKPVLKIEPEPPAITLGPRLRTNPYFMAGAGAYRPFRIGIQINPDLRAGIDPELGIGFVHRF